MANVTQTLACTGSARVDIRNTSKNEHGAASYDMLQTESRAPALLLQFAQLGSSYLYKKLITYQLKIFYTTNYASATVVSFPLGGAFDPATVTDGNRPSAYSVYGGTAYAPKTGTNVTISPGNAEDVAEAAGFVTQYLGFYLWAGDGGAIGYPPDSANFIVYTESASADKRPHLLVTVDDSVTVTSKVVGKTGTAGYHNPHIALTFGWVFEIDGANFCAGRWTQASATFLWSSDDGATWNSVAASGSTQSVTLPAETLPAGSIQWKVTATDNQGTTTTSPVYSINTADTLPTCTLLEPLNTLEANDGPILFRWSATNASGTLPTSYRLSWRDASVSPPAWTYEEFPAGTTQWLAPANTFPAGQMLWWVLARNIDNANGPWSATGQFTSVGAPAAPIVSCDGKPFATISWQAAGQQAWRLTVDGKLYGPYFGGAKTYILPDYLEDGEHTASVEVQGQYGLWSQPGTVTFTVSNVPGDAVTLKAVCYRDAELRWETDSETRDFLVYRDGVRIGHTPYAIFTDRRSIGRHSWQVINRLAGGYYTASNIVQGELRSCTPAAAILSGGEWLELRKSDAQTREDVWQGSQTAAIRHFAGEEYPTAEFSVFRDETVSLSVAWMPEEAEEARRFESLIGQPVIYKNRDRMLIGVLQAFNLRRPQFYRAYSVTLTRIHWRDFVDEDA